MHTHQERTQAGTGSSRFREAADDELLALGAFDLEPLPASPRTVRLIRLFRDNSLETVATAFLIEFITSADPMLAVAERQ